MVSLGETGPGKGPRLPMGPTPFIPTPPSDIEILVREVQSLKAEIVKIKQALNKHGIQVD